MGNIKTHWVEVSIFVAVILLLSIGTYSRNRLWSDEISLLTDCVKKSPNKARPHGGLGVAYFNIGAYDKSLEFNKKAIQIDPKFGEAYHNIGLTYQKMGDFRKAIEMEKKSLELDPTLYIAYYSLGSIYFENGQYEEAEKAFQKFVQIFPYFPEVHNLLAIIYAAQKKFDKTTVELGWELRINPNNSLAHVNLGQIYWYEFHDKRKALYHFKTALMLDPYIPKRGEIRKLVSLLEGLP